MRKNLRRGALALVLFALLLSVFPLAGCGGTGAGDSASSVGETEAPDSSRFLVAVDEEPDTVDFQCTTIYYTIAQNVFDRLVEMESDENGNISILPSLAESWQISKDRCSYTFRLREGITFSNGSPLTASDVGYTLTRLLTHPNSNNRDIAERIQGAHRLESGESNRLTGFELLDELEFRIVLEEPFEAFLACLSMPGASILDRETTEEAGDRFGMEPEWTIGTGPFILKSWTPLEGMILVANPNCWSGPPACAGLDLRFLNESQEVRTLFENGELDILDLDDLDETAEYFYHGDVYQSRLHEVRPIGITYVALNSSLGPLQDVRVRKALQLGLNRTALLDAVYSGRGSLENGILPHGLYGYDPELPEIPYDPDQAAELLAQAGYAEGFDLTFSVRASATQSLLTLVRMAASMWEKLGIRVNVRIMEESEWMPLRKAGALECYAATWIADYNDPDNFMFTFFGSAENSRFRSLCYSRQEILERVRAARGIGSAQARIAEYQALEQIIVQEDAAWVPLFSRTRCYLTSERLEGFRTSWNGWFKNNYRYMSIK